MSSSEPMQMGSKMRHLLNARDSGVLGRDERAKAGGGGGLHGCSFQQDSMIL